MTEKQGAGFLLPVPHKNKTEGSVRVAGGRKQTHRGFRLPFFRCRRSGPITGEDDRNRIGPWLQSVAAQGKREEDPDYLPPLPLRRRPRRSHHIVAVVADSRRHCCVTVREEEKATGLPSRSLLQKQVMRRSHGPGQVQAWVGRV